MIEHGLCNQSVHVYLGNGRASIGKVGIRCRTVERGHDCAWRLLPVGREQLSS